MQDVVILLDDPVPSETKQELAANYQGLSLMVPTLPFIMGNDGATLLQTISAGYSGDSIFKQATGFYWIITPDRQLTFVRNGTASAYPLIQNALDSRTIAIKPNAGLSNIQNRFGIISSAGMRINLTVPQSGKYELSFFGANGKLVSTRFMTCLAGKNYVEMRELAQGVYVVKFSGSAGVVSRVCRIGF